MRRLPRALLVSVMSAVVLAHAATSAAQGQSSNEAAAEALFNEARTLIDAGKREEGCKKLEASQALDPGTGTLLHLADCYEKTGRTATAWARFREAASRAARDGHADWESIAKTRAAELEPKLAHLRIDASPGVLVRRDGDEIPTAALGSLLPIDPGEHTLSATARGKKPWSTHVTVTAASVATVTVPALDDDGSARGADGAADTRSSGSAFRTVGYTAGAVGLVGVAVGVVSGLSAISLNSRSKDKCPTSGICADQAARSDADSARSAATISTIGFVAGGTLLAAGIALVVFAPTSSPSSPPATTAKVRVSPQALWLEGTW
jgi:hypothetical protein